MYFLGHTACNWAPYHHFSRWRTSRLAGSPPLPENRIEVSDGCLSGSSERCRAITYTTPESPESVIRSWSGKNGTINIYNGTKYYNYDACNYSFFGRNYAVLHAYPLNSLGFSCAGVSVHYDQDVELTVIRVYLSWTDCLRIVKFFGPNKSRLYRQCFNG